MSDTLPGIIAGMRRLYHHMVHGGEITADDLSRQIAALERVQIEIARLHAFVEWVHLYTNDPEISAEASKHLAPLPWENGDV